MGLNRRTFLQQAGFTLLTLGVSETGLFSWETQKMANRYFQTLAQPTARKLALLVGINQYPRTTALNGAVTDVELQRELLIHRFGFNPQDILTLTNQQATREDVETAFVEHLTEQAKPGDVVVFHFSGYGSQVKVPQTGTEAGESDTEQPPYSLVNSLVPVDGIVQTKGEPAVNDILEDTLVLLLRSLATDKVTMVLDTSYRNKSQVIQGGLRLRSCPNPPAERPSPEELAFQEQLQIRISSTQGPLKRLVKGDASLPGIVLSAAKEGQSATEGQWNGFSAGLFTYALTQHLWQAMPASTVQVSVSRSAQLVERVTGKQQQPQFSGSKMSKQPLLTYFVPPNPIGVEGVITGIEEEGKTAQLVLSGLPANVLSDYGVNSRFKLLPAPYGENSEESESPKPIPDLIQLQLRSREGWKAKARLVANAASEEYSLAVGQQVQEVIRVIKRNPGLTVALDMNLQRIERVDATSAFANIEAVSSVIIAGEGAADCLLGKVKEPQAKKAAEMGLSDPSGGYALFSLFGVAIPNTRGTATEAVKSAVNRLVPKLKTLLAAKLWRLTLNEGSSRLPVSVTLETVDPVNNTQQLLLKRQSVRAKESVDSKWLESVAEEASHSTSATLPAIPTGSRIQYRIHNDSDSPVYIMLVGLDTSRNAIALYSPETVSETETSGSQPNLQNTEIPPGESLLLPHPSASFNWMIPGPGGIGEIQILCSRLPFTKTLALLRQLPHPKGDGERVVDLPNPLEVSQALLQDLHNASGVNPEIYASATDVYAFDVNAWATFNFVYQVV